MNIAQIRNLDVANGKGIRVSVFVSGCIHNCYNCFNKEYQDYSYGDEFSNKHIIEIQEALDDSKIRGLSILGGEPMDSPKGLVELINNLTFKKQQDIWLWSGYEYEDIVRDRQMKKLLAKIDILIDGKFVESKKDLTLKFRGSSNQRVINVQESIKADKVVLLQDF